jgi:hypothetical protein
MAHPDKSWRVGAIYRCCVRYNKDMLWAKAKIAELSTLSADGKVIAGRSYPRLVDIWFRRSHPTAPNHIEQQRHEYRLRKATA